MYSNLQFNGMSNDIKIRLASETTPCADKRIHSLVDIRRKMKLDPSNEYVEYICNLYGDTYDDRIEDSRPQGTDWKPGGLCADHLSLERFKKLLMSDYGIELSTSKIRKILISGGRWTTEQSRRIQEEFETLGSIKKVADKLGLSTAFVTMNLPYEKAVYDLKDKSGNARRVERWRDRQMTKETTVTKENLAVKADLTEENTQNDWKVQLWQSIINCQGMEFTTSGRGNRPGIRYTYSVSKQGGRSGKKYDGTSIDGFGNEMVIAGHSKSISRSTVELAYRNALAVQESVGYVSGPKKLGVPGAGSYLYPIFIKIGAIMVKI